MAELPPTTLVVQSFTDGNLTYDRNTGEIGITKTPKAFSHLQGIGSGERYMQFQQYAIARRALTLKDDTRRCTQAANCCGVDKKTKNNSRTKSANWRTSAAAGRLPDG